QAAWGPRPPFEVPIFVLTHRARHDDVRDGSTFHFVTEGFSAALERAYAAVSGTDVAFHGGGAIKQALNHGALDELQVHLVPVLLRRGRRLFDDVQNNMIALEQTRVVARHNVTHLKYRVLGAGLPVHRFELPPRLVSRADNSDRALDVDFVVAAE